MSNISNRHSVSTFVSAGKDRSVAYSGQRLSVARFKVSKDNPNAKSQCVSIPKYELSVEERNALSTQINEWFWNQQDAIIRDRVVAGADAITDEEISVTAVLSYLTQQAAGERLTGDSIKEWFVAELQDILLVAFADKMGIGNEPTDEQTEKLQRICNVYRDKFATLAGGRTVVDADSRQKMLKALELIDCSDGVAAKLLARLNAQSNVSVEEFLGL